MKQIEVDNIALQAENEMLKDKIKYLEDVVSSQDAELSRIGGDMVGMIIQASQMMRDDEKPEYIDMLIRQMIGGDDLPLTPNNV